MKKINRFTKSKQRIFIIHYYNEILVIKMPNSKKFVYSIIEWILFKYRYGIYRADDQFLTIQQLSELLTKYYNANIVDISMQKLRLKKYHVVHHIDERLITFYYDSKTFKHYQRLMNSLKFEQEINSY